MPGFITIDASDLIKTSRDINRVAAMTPRALESALTRAANARLKMLKYLAPWQMRHDDRHPGHLEDSFSMIKQQGIRFIVTSAPNKLTWNVEGTRRHFILPRFKKALYWPGIQNDRPVAYVLHPGTEPFDFVTAANDAFAYEGGPYVNILSTLPRVSTSVPLSTSKKVKSSGGSTFSTASKISKSATSKSIESDTQIFDTLLDGMVMGIMGSAGLLATVIGVVVGAAAAVVEASQD